MMEPRPEPAIAELEVLESKPTIRIRIEHTHTLKDGWRLSSTTVEYTGPVPIDALLIRDELRQAAVIGEAEARYRNEETT